MRKLILPALGAALCVGGISFGPMSSTAGAQVMGTGVLPGFPGFRTDNRVPGSAPNFSSTAPLPPPSGLPPIGQRGDLNREMPEFAGPGERDETGRIGPTVERRARFAGERGADGKLLPTYTPNQQAQAPQSPRVPQAPQTPPQTDEQRMRGPTQPMPQQRPGSGAADQPGMGTMDQQRMQGQPMQDRMDRDRMQTQPRQRDEMMRGSAGQSRGMSQPPNATALLNNLSADGYRVTSQFERVGNQWQAQAVKDGQNVTVVVDPRTGQYTTR
ncbi:MAG TPA: hypothetical protein VF342_02265 [Alphaproteobacteria bacterium]